MTSLLNFEETVRQADMPWQPRHGVAATSLGGLIFFA
jgi:hypothetical protein